MNEARGIGLDFTECSFRHMAQTRARSARGPDHVLTPICLFQPCRLEDVRVRPLTSARKMFPRALAKHMVLLSSSKTSIAVFGMLIAATVKDAFQEQRSLAVTTQEFR